MRGGDGSSFVLSFTESGALLSDTTEAVSCHSFVSCERKPFLHPTYFLDIPTSWGHQSFCTTCQKPADRGHSLKMPAAPSLASVETIAVKALYQNLAGRGDLSRRDALSGCSEVGSKFPL
jgi:hypothetical protein